MMIVGPTWREVVSGWWVFQFECNGTYPVAVGVFGRLLATAVKQNGGALLLGGTNEALNALFGLG